MSHITVYNKPCSIAVYILMVAMLAIFSLAFSAAPVYGQSEASTRKTKRVQTVSQKNAKKFEKIATLFDENKDASAKAILDKFSVDSSLNNFEKAYVANFLGAYYFERDQLNKALKEYKKIIVSPDGIPSGFYSQTFYTIAQVYFSKEDYKNALDYAKRWFGTTDNPPADAYMLVGQAHYALKQYDKALPNVKKGIQKYIEVGSKPKEGWLNLLSSIYREKNDYKSMLPIVKQLIRYYPKKNYLLTIAGVYNELGRQDKMASVYQAMYDKNLIGTEAEIITLASLLLSEDNSYQAAKILEKAFDSGVLKNNSKNYRLYAQALLIAKEYEAALQPLSKAASLATNGKLYYQLGQSYMALNRWSEAEKAFKKAFEKAGLGNSGNALISLGLVQFELKKYSQAKTTFNKALKYEKSAKDAKNWIKYIDAEMFRIQELNKPVVIDTSVNV